MFSDAAQDPATLDRMWSNSGQICRLFDQTWSNLVATTSGPSLGQLGPLNLGPILANIEGIWPELEYLVEFGQALASIGLKLATVGQRWFNQGHI